MRRKLASLVAACAAVALVLTACGDSGGETEASSGFEDCFENPNTCNSGERQQGGDITWVVDFTPSAYFPWSPEGGSVATIQSIHGILPFFGQFLPGGEYEYNMDVLSAEPELLSEDPFTYQFQINPQAVWDDGTSVSANDAILLWKMSTSEEEGHCIGCRSRSSGGFDTIESVEGSDNGQTITVTLKEGISDPEWFAFGSAHGIIGGLPPSHVATQQGLDIEDPEDLGEFFEFLNDNPPEFSAGPYMIQEFDLETQVVMVPNPNWYGEEQPTLDRIVKVFNDAEDTWVPALQNGEIHGGNSAFPEDVIRQMLDMDGVRVHMQSGPSWAHVDVNLNNEWLGEHQALRQAIFTTIDASDISARIFGDLFPDYTLRTNHVQRVDSEYHVDHLADTGQGSGDLDRARQILADAGFEGYEEGAGPLTFEGEQVGPFRLRSGQSPQLTIALQLQQSYLAEIGIEVNIETTDDLGGTLTTQDYDLMQFSWSGSPLFTGTGGQFWETGSGSNFGGYSNADVDALIEQERQATSLEESAAIHDQMMEIVVDEAYVLPLYDGPVFIFVTEDYVGVRDNTNSSLRGVYSQTGWGLAADQ
jgi:peptide/nickel transport system substrate-binding protein